MHLLFPLLAQAVAAGAVDPALPPAPPELSFGWLFFKTIVAMVLVIGLAFLTIRYVLPKIHLNRFRGSGNIRIIDRTGLEPRKNLYIVEVGTKLALVGTSEHGIEKLLDLDPSDVKENNE